MPKPRRSSAAAFDDDSRPAFARPPGARRVSAARDSTPEKRTPTSSPQKAARTKAKQSPATTPRKSQDVRHVRRKSGTPGRTYGDSSPSPTKTKAKYTTSVSVGESTQALSFDAIGKLNAYNEKVDSKTKTKDKDLHRRKDNEKVRVHKKDVAAVRTTKKKDRYVNAVILEEGRGEKSRPKTRLRGGGSEIYERVKQRGGRGGDTGKRKKMLWCFIVLVILLLLIILIPIGVLVLGKHHTSSSSGSSSTTTSSTSTAGLPDEDTIPAAAKGTVLDPYTWLDTTDFNTTYTNETFGGLPIMGLNSTWDDSVRANANVPPLNQNWTYGPSGRPIRGVNIGGWLSIEPWITPSLFNTYSESDGVIDEYTLTTRLGSTLAAQEIEKHYATWVNRQTFVDIAAAGLDHVRIPYPYWAVTTYDGDPYVPKIAWRYLLRGIEYARQNGLRVNLDLHALPGSQNGWNHSGRQGVVGWLNGTDGTLNGQRSLDIHNQLSQFFAQPRYDNVVTFYGLVNEPKMLDLDTDTVLTWNKEAIKIIRDNGLDKYLTFGDGFLALTAWADIFKDVDDKLVMDTHQYMIFNTGELAYNHQTKVNLACDGWASMLETSENASKGWGPLLSGEWSQADTDCATYLNNVNVGSRWTGTMDTGDTSTQVLTPTCPWGNSSCTCDGANADPSEYSSEYKAYLLMLAEAQMYAFEQVWGWFYWTWTTESAPQWSWQQGVEAGILPKLAYDPSFTCNSDVPDFASLGLSEGY